MGWTYSRFSLSHVKWSSKGDAVFENTSQTVLFMTSRVERVSFTLQMELVHTHTGCKQSSAIVEWGQSKRGCGDCFSWKRKDWSWTQGLDDRFWIRKLPLTVSRIGKYRTVPEWEGFSFIDMIGKCIFQGKNLSLAVPSVQKKLFSFYPYPTQIAQWSSPETGNDNFLFDLDDFTARNAFLGVDRPTNMLLADLSVVGSTSKFSPLN